MKTVSRDNALHARPIQTIHQDRMRTPIVRPDLKPFYFVLIAAGAIVAHLAAEFAAMGSDADEVLFSPRHWYLGLTALACIVTFCVRGKALLAFSSGGRDLKRLLHIGLDTLPYSGTGLRFFGMTAGLQLGIGMLTQIGEGCPFCSHDVAGGVFGAMLTVILLALATRAAAARMPSLVDTFIRLLPSPRPTHHVDALAVDRDATSLPLALWTAPLYNRPPPTLQFAIASL